MVAQQNNKCHREKSVSTAIGPSWIILPLWFLLLSMGLEGFAQTKMARSAGTRPINIEVFDAVEGLSQGQINGLVEDRDGYLWLGTKDGLNRFDGKTFTVFRNDPKDSFSIPDNYINSICLDADGRIWSLTRAGHFSYFIPEKQCFQRFNNPWFKELRTNKEREQIAPIPGGGLTVFALNRSTLQVLLPSVGASPKAQHGHRLERIADINPDLHKLISHSHLWVAKHFDKEGSLWFFRRDSLFRFHPTKDWTGGDFQTFADSAYYSGKLYPPFILDHFKNGVYWSKSNDLGLLLKYDAAKKEFAPFLRLPEPFTFQGAAFIDSDNNLWNWRADGKILLVNLDSGNYTIIEPIWSRPMGSHAHYGRWLEDRKGNIWLGTNGHGLLKIGSTSRKFKILPPPPQNAKDRFHWNRMGRPGNAALFDSKLSAWWKNNKVQIRAKFEAQGCLTLQQYLNFDHNGALWMLAQRPNKQLAYLIKIDTSTLNYEPVLEIQDVPGSYWGLPFMFDEEGDIWCSEKPNPLSQNLYKYAIDNDELLTYPIPVSVPMAEYPFVSDLYSDSVRKILWLGTTHGLYGFNKVKETWQYYLHNPEDDNSLSHNLVLCLFPDPDQPTQFLWIGTEGGGLNKLDLRTGGFTHYTTKTGLPNNVINGILPDKHNNLWLSTNNGLCRFNTQTGECLVFHQKDGLPGNEFNRYEYSMSAAGELYFGGVNGWMHFNPEEFYPEAKESKLLIHELRLMNQPVVFDSENPVLQAPLEFTKSLTFGHKDVMITFAFTLLDLSRPEKNRFKYKLEGFSDQWIDLGTTSEASFTGLPAGDYTLNVLGGNSMNVWAAQPTSLSFKVLSPWWATWWFRCAILLLIGSLLYALYRYRLAQLLRIEQMRNRIAQDLHDEIGSTISSISLFGSVLKNTLTKNPEKADKIIDRITTYSSKAGERMNDLVWAIRPENDSLEHMINRMRAFAVNLTESKGVDLVFNIDPKVESLTLSMETRKNIYLVFKEAVNNAIKYSNGNELLVVIALQGNHFVQKIKDNGDGFDIEEVDAMRGGFGGNGLKNMRFRAENLNAHLEINSWLGKGTEIVLKFEP